MMIYPLQNPITCFIKEKFLYDMDETKSGILACQIIGISVYKDYAVLFEVLVDGAFLYSDVPVHAFLSTHKLPTVELSFKELSYCNADSDVVEACHFPALDKKLSAFFKEINKWLDAEYLLTITLTAGNLNFHLLSVENGQFALSPNHKISVSGERYLPKYKKNRQDWKII